MTTEELEIQYEYVPGLAGVPATKSGISYLDGLHGILEYRGIRIEELAQKSNFIETAYLLIEGHLPTKSQLEKFDADLRQHRRLKFQIKDMIKMLPETGHPMEALQAGVAAIGMFYPKDINDPVSNYESGVRLIAKLPTIIAAFERARHGDEPIDPRDDLDHAANFLYMLHDRVPDELTARVLDACLVLHAEHTINASTFSAMVTASTLADPYTVISSAIGTLFGPLHGGANEQVLIMLREIADPAKARDWINAKIDAKARIMGVGHREYKTKDPRATILQGLAKELFKVHGTTPLYDIAEIIEDVVSERMGPRGIYPNVDFYSGIVYDKMGIPMDAFTPIFAMSRVSGWVAHWREQVGDNRIFRPTQIYTGQREQHWVPVSQRTNSV